MPPNSDERPRYPTKDKEDQLKSEQEITGSEARYRELVEELSDWVWEADLEGRYTYSNSSIERLLGYKPEEVIGKTPFDLIIEEDRDEARQVFQNVVERKSDIDRFLNRCVTKEGEIRYIETSGRPIFDEQGELIGFRGVDRDITDGIKAQETLKENEARYRLLFENNPLPMLVYDLETLKILAVNNVAINHYGYSREEFLSMTLSDLHLQEEIPRLQENISRVTEGLDIAGVWRHIKKDGEIIDVDIVSHTIVWGSRRAEIVLANDVTERLKAEKSLKASEENYRAIFNAANNVIFVHDPETGAILDVNEKIAEMYGYAPEEIKGLTIVDISSGKPPYTQERAVGLVRAAQEKPQLFEWRAKDKQSSEFWVEVNLKKAVIGGQDRILAIVRDITERKYTEEALEKSLEFQQVITSLATNFINLPSSRIDEGVNKALEVISEFIEADRSFVFMVDPDGKTFSNTHEWHAEGVESYFEVNQNLKIENFRLTQLAYKRHRATIIPDVEKLSDVYKNERVMLLFQKVKSFVAIPLLFRDQPIGYLGFVTVRRHKDWPEESITLLKLVGEIIVNALERKQTEQDLLESEEKFRAVVEQSRDGISIGMPDGKTIIYNKAMERISGYSKEEANEHGWFNLAFPDQQKREKAYELAAKVLQGEIDYAETQIIRKDSRQVWVNFSLTPIVIEGQKYNLGIMTDITDRKIAEEAIKISEANFRAIFDYAPAAVVAFDRNATILQANAACERILGYTKEQMVGKSMFETFAREEDRERTTELIERVFDGNIIENLEFLDIKADGTPIYLLSNVTPVYDREGNITMAIVLGIDITDRKLAENRRGELEKHKREFYRRTILAATDGKLAITEKDEIEEVAGEPITTWDIAEEESLSGIRGEISKFLGEKGMGEGRIYDFVLAIGEAATNAYKHAGGGIISVHQVDDSIMAVVEDQGKGIEALTLPEVALVKGYSTVGSLGMGYKAILSIADTVYLATGPGGTTVGIFMNLHPPETPPLESVLPDTWGASFGGKIK